MKPTYDQKPEILFWALFYIFFGLNFALLLSPADSVTIDHEATINVSGRGHSPGKGTSPGIHHSNGGSGASHGGRGGMGAYVSSAKKAYGNLLRPRELGSGGSDGGGSGVSVRIIL